MLADNPVLSMDKKSFVVFISDAQYAPAVQSMNLLAAAENFQVQALKRFGSLAPAASAVKWFNIHSISTEVQKHFQGVEAAFVFVTPVDLFDVVQLTRSLLVVATEAGVRRFAWVAPACPAKTELSKRLTEAANLVCTSGLETLVLHHAPLLSDLLDQKKELRFRCTLSLPLGDRGLSWLAPEVIANGLERWVRNELNS